MNHAIPGVQRGTAAFRSIQPRHLGSILPWLLGCLLLGISPYSPAEARRLPDGEITRGQAQIAEAWLTRPTDRYDHGILGDAIEAGGVMVQLRGGTRHEYVLTTDSVFEDRYPRLADLDGDGQDELYLIRSRLEKGAALAVFEAGDNGLRLAAETPPIGLPYRWLNPAGVADFDGDGEREIALVITPHIGGTLKLYAYRNGKLIEKYRMEGFSNHAIRTREMRLSAILDADRDGLPDLAIPSSDRTRLRIISFAGGTPRQIGQFSHTRPIASPIRLSGPDENGGQVLQYRLSDGRAIEQPLP